MPDTLAASSQEEEAADSTAAAWQELKTYLERRSKALSAQVRNYPDAVPRQEDELLELIEQRSDTRGHGGRHSVVLRPEALPN